MDFRIELRGDELLMKNGRLANPLDPLTRELALLNSKQRKTEDDYLAIAKTEFLGSLYFDPTVGVYVPGDNVWSMLVEAGKKHKLGTYVRQALVITTPACKLSYDGDDVARTGQKLWEDERFRHQRTVKMVGGGRVLRTRPWFHGWSLAADGYLDESVMQFDQLTMIADTAGTRVGLGDWRPKYGRFEAKVVEL